MLSQETLRELGLTRDFPALTSFPDKPNPTIIVASDVEGPFQVGDPVMSLMRSRVKHGGEMYGDFYDSFSAHRRTGRYHPVLAQEAGDTIFTLPFLLAEGVTNADMLAEARASKATPGAQKVADFIKSNGGLLVGLTSAPEFAYTDILAKMGFDRVIGTPFPLDQVGELLRSTGRWDYEMELVQRFTNDYLRLISNEALTPTQRQARFEYYLEKELGASFEHGVRSNRNGHPHQTLLGQVMESDAAIGDDSKDRLAKMIFETNAGPQTITVTKGDGENDRLMLRNQGRYSIATNSPAAVLDAKIGVISPNLAPALIPMYDFMLRNPDAPTEEVVRFTKLALRWSDMRDYATIHLGGPDTSPELLAKHKQMKSYIRGNQILY